MKWLAGLALLSASAIAFAQLPAPVVPAVPQGEPRSGDELRDGDFGVATREFGLDRRVEMYQWRSGEDGYRRVWNSALIDSAGFAPGHDNPPELPLQSERWWSEDATLDGRPLDHAVLTTLGQWQQFRPNFSRLPANLAATFQPEGDGLGSAENPLDPQIGDLRVSWRELVLPPLASEVQLREGVWQLTAEHARPPGAAGAPALPADSRRDEPAGNAWRWFFVVLLGMLGVAVAMRGRRARDKR